MSEYERFLEIVARLRAEDGCPWDRAQTHGSLKQSCIEEACEVVSGVNILENTGNPENLKEELGDLLLNIFLQAEIAKEEGYFTMEDVFHDVCEKMIRRHPHVFSGRKFDSDEEFHQYWAEIKKSEKVGKEWMADYLPEAFEESKELINVAIERKKKK